MRTLSEECPADAHVFHAARLDVYHKQTQPLIDYYTGQNILKTVDGTVDMMDVFTAITEILGE